MRNIQKRLLVIWKSLEALLVAEIEDRNNNEKGVSVFTITNKVYMKCDKRGWSCQLKQIAKYPCNDIGKQ